MFNIVLVKLYFFKWFYGSSFLDIFRIWKNFLWFVYHFFSLPLLFKDFLAPWRRINEEPPKGFSLENILSAFIVNTIMRAVGVMIRSFFIVIGSFLYALVFLGGILFFVVWALLPPLLALMFAVGWVILFSK